MIPRFLHLVLFGVIAITMPLSAQTADPKKAEDPKETPEPKEPPKKAGPRVDICLVIDTTGSMGGVLKTMVERAYALCGTIKGGKPGPDLRVGIVAFKDRGDEYVTKIISMTSDLDKIYEELKALRASGGGDAPESVNAALHDAVNHMNWDKDAKLRLVFLMGDAPAHTDYKDDVQYKDTLKVASRKNIRINTIRNGTSIECETQFKEIAKLGRGEYFSVPQDGGAVLAIPTPQDKRLAEINGEFLKLSLPYGAADLRAAAAGKVEALKKLSEVESADRAIVEARRDTVTTTDLAEMIRSGKIKLADVPENELPPEIKRIPAADRDAHIRQHYIRKREALAKEALDLDIKRAAFINKKAAELERKNPVKSFDRLILDVLKKQGNAVGIRY